MELFNLFASGFAVINEIDDTTGGYPHTTEAPIYQPKKWPLDAYVDAARGKAAGRLGVG